MDLVSPPLPHLRLRGKRAISETKPPILRWFLASKGNEYFCEVDEEYIVDRFNLTGLNAEVSGYSAALDLITDTAGMHSPLFSSCHNLDRTDETAECSQRTRI